MTGQPDKHGRLFPPKIDARVEHDAPATQHRVIPVEWHRVAVEPARKMPISGGGHVVDPDEDDAPARVEPQQKVTCGCRSGLSWPCPTCYKASLPVSAAQPATDDRTADTIPLDLKRDYEDARGGGHFSYGNYHVARIIERTGRAETRIEVLEAALRRHDKAALAMDSVTPKDTVKYDGSKLQAATWLALAAPSGEEKP